jgi:Ca2+/Na+ antiporter
MNPAQVMTAVGALVTLAGLVLVIFQMLQTKRTYPSRSVKAQAGPLKFDLKTTFVGLVVLAFGVILLVVSAVMNR